MDWHPKRLVIFDTEYVPADREPVPVCLVAHIFDVDAARGLIPAGVLICGWEEMYTTPPPPWLDDPDTVTIAFSGHTDLEVLRLIGWPTPRHYIDAMTELRVLLCGHPAISQSAGLYRYLDFFEIQHPPKSYKSDLRDLILAGQSHTQKAEVLEYCELDVTLLAKLIAKVFSLVDWKRAVGFRGETAKVFSKIESRGLPVDVGLLEKLKRHWPEIQADLRAWVNQELGFPIYDENGVFKRDQVARWLDSRGLLSRWPRTTKSNEIQLDAGELRQWAKRDRQFAVLYESMKTLSQGGHGLRLDVHSDGRARCWMNPFGTRTARCAPKEPEDSAGFDRGGGFLFAGARWIRALMKPSPGTALAYLDFSGQEILIGAALSGDKNLMECYTAHDPYVRFAQLAGALPADATKKSHPEIRAKFKTVFLGLGYGMGAESLAFRLNSTVSEAAALVRLHHGVFRDYWRWSEAVRVKAYETQEIQNIFGWRMTVHHGTRPTSLGNWPVQSTGAAMLHAALIQLDAAGVEVIATVHDAVLLQAPAADIEAVTARATEIMKRAAVITTRGHECRVDAKIVTWPSRYRDEDDGGMFDRIEAALARVESMNALAEIHH